VHCLVSWNTLQDGPTHADGSTPKELPFELEELHEALRVDTDVLFSVEQLHCAMSEEWLETHGSPYPQDHTSVSYGPKTFIQIHVLSMVGLLGLGTWP